MRRVSARIVLYYSRTCFQACSGQMYCICSRVIAADDDAGVDGVDWSSPCEDVTSESAALCGPSLHSARGSCPLQRDFHSSHHLATPLCKNFHLAPLDFGSSSLRLVLDNDWSIVERATSLSILQAVCLHLSSHLRTRVTFISDTPWRDRGRRGL